jgi:hypothetical protein
VLHQSQNPVRKLILNRWLNAEAEARSNKIPLAAWNYQGDCFVPHRQEKAVMA